MQWPMRRPAPRSERAHRLDRPHRLDRHVDVEAGEQLGIEQGAYFEGKSRRVDDPLAGASMPSDSGPAGPGFPLRGNG